MAFRRPAHRKGTTGQQWRKFRASVLASSAICGRCGEADWVTDAPCNHPTHADLKGCPTHPRYPTLGHIKALKHGGKVRDRANARPEHFRCNASAGDGTRRPEGQISWDW